jgi:cytochrome c-type biogenesis protein
MSMGDLAPFFTISVFFAGLISFFAPCIIPLLPVYISVFTGGLPEPEKSIEGKVKFRINGKLVLKTLVFVLGLGTTFILLGFGAGALGSILASKTFIIIAGSIVILLGLHQTGIFHILFLDREKKLEIKTSKESSTLSIYLLGLTFSFGWTPCVGPILATVLALSNNGNGAIYGAFLMLVYTIGLGIPFILISVFTEYLLKTFHRINKHLNKIRIIGGILIILMGIALMTDKLNLISNLFIKR